MSDASQRTCPSRHRLADVGMLTHMSKAAEENPASGAACQTDYGAAAAKHSDSFFNHIDWDTVSHRV